MLLRTVFAVALVLIPARSFAFFDCAYMNQTLSQWTETCALHGVRVEKWDVCNVSEIAITKRSIDWVLHEDPGALASFKSGLLSAEKCMPGGVRFMLKGHSHTENEIVDALIYAQRHNMKAQCAIALCKSDLWGIDGLLTEKHQKKLIPTAGKLW